MSAQTDELDNVIASLININASLKAELAGVPVAPAEPVVEAPVAPEVPAVPEAPVETPAEEAAEEASEPADGQVADNTPSATITVG